MSLAVGHWTVRDYERAVERGVFGPEPRIELLRGEIYEVSPISPRHANVVRRLDALARSLGGVEVGCQCPVTISDHSEPEPDLWLARDPGSYCERHPSAADLTLVVEVSDTTLRYDLGVKVPLYLAAGIPQVWVVDLTANVVHEYTAAGSATRTEGPVRNVESGLVVVIDELLA